MSECKEIKKIINSMAHDIVDDSELSVVKRHIESCEHCRTNYKAVQTAKMLFKTHTPEHDRCLSTFNDELRHKLLTLKSQNESII